MSIDYKPHSDRLYEMFEKHEDEFFEVLDEYGRKNGLSDSQLLWILQDWGHRDMADRYHEWIWAGAEGAGEGSI